MSVDPTAVFEAIAHRRSLGLKELRPDPVPRELIARMLEAANWAPTHGLTEPWRFKVYTGEARRTLGEAFGAAFRAGTPPNQYTPAGEAAQRDRVWQAPVWIAVGFVPGLRPNIPEIEDIMATACAAHNAQLVASALGLGSKWTTGLTANHPVTAEFVGFEPPTKLLGFLYVGYPAVPWPRGKRQPIDVKVAWAGD